MTGSVIEEVSTWFRERGFSIAVSEQGDDWWASLTPVDNPAAVVARYGRGDSAQSAALRARERYEQEQ